MLTGFSNNKSSLTNAFVDDRSFSSVFGDTNTTSSSTTTTGELRGVEVFGCFTSKGVQRWSSNVILR